MRKGYSMKRITPALCRAAAATFTHRKLLPAGFTARPCTIEDLDAVLTLGRAGFSYNPPTRAEITHALTKAHAAIFGLYDGNILAGYVFVEGHMGRKNLYINTTLIAEAYRGRGLGSALYELAEMLARDMDASNLWCHTAENNTANIEVMKKRAYKKERREEEYYQDGRAAFVFRKRLG